MITNDLQIKPTIFDLSKEDDAFLYDTLIQNNKYLTIVDQIFSQLKDLIKIKNIGTTFTEQEMQNAIDTHLQNIDIGNYGNWVFYPWKNTLVHILPEQEFIAVKTNRNCNKITMEEQAHLATKKVGIIGLSVGQSVATTIAMERSASEIRLADFDTLDLSNCNRLRTSIINLGIPKVVITAREIAELDPYLKVECYTDGITLDNIDDFYTKNGKLDLVIEECDSIDVKIFARQKAKELQIPVLMEMSDKGMIDVERYDLQPNYKMFHGALEDFDCSISTIQNLQPAQKMQYLFSMVDYNSVSQKMKDSMPEIGKTILTWPQLASAVVLGGGVSADVTRRIFLNQFTDSGRFYIDIEELIKNKI